MAGVTVHDSREEALTTAIKTESDKRLKSIHPATQCVCYAAELKGWVAGPWFELCNNSDKETFRLVAYGHVWKMG